MADKKAFSDNEKLEVIEHFIVQWKPAATNTIEGERQTLLILKEIARDIRSRTPERTNEAIVKIEGALTVARANRTAQGFKVGHLAGIGQLMVRYWPTIRQSLEKFGNETSREES